MASTTNWGYGEAMSNKTVYGRWSIMFENAKTPEVMMGPLQGHMRSYRLREDEPSY